MLLKIANKKQSASEEALINKSYMSPLSFPKKVALQFPIIPFEFPEKFNG
jgi:hypothetical protein